MDTRIFHNKLVLVHLDAKDLSVRSHKVVETPMLTCRFTDDVKVSGRRFLDEVNGPMDARLVRSVDGEPWVSFYAERNLPGSDEVVRGIHAAPLHIDWQPCESAAEAEGWDVHAQDSAFVGPGCRWLGGQGDGSSESDCRASCDAQDRCNAVSFRDGHCELHECTETVDTMPLPGWKAWLRPSGTMQPRWHRAADTCGWLTQVAGESDLQQCWRSCEDTATCNAIVFSEGYRVCSLRRCQRDGSRRPIPPGWEVWHLNSVQQERKCLSRVWIEQAELLAFPAVNGVEKNWNLIRVERERILVEYHVDPHIVLEAHIRRGGRQTLYEGDTGAGEAEGEPFAELVWLVSKQVSRWPYEVIHGVSNVRGGYCCLTLPATLLEGWRGAGDQNATLPERPLLLGVGHLQRIRTPFDQAKGNLDRFRRQAQSRTYHQFFYLLRSEDPFDVVAVSTEWCVTINGRFSAHWQEELASGEEACEAIQFAGGLALRGPHEILVSYGINDCEGDLLTLPTARVLAMLRPVQSALNVNLDDLDMI